MYFWSGSRERSKELRRDEAYMNFFVIFIERGSYVIHFMISMIICIHITPLISNATGDLFLK